MMSIFVGVAVSRFAVTQNDGDEGNEERQEKGAKEKKMMSFQWFNGHTIWGRKERKKDGNDCRRDGRDVGIERRKKK